ncbi:MAG: amphi-Trp domain-containing protein [Desulfovibrionaceae bacterium]|nr:amphi-Trp domain-containing protein [Desulfovibrionaceae bacterium]
MAEEKFIFDSLQDCRTIKDFLASLTDGFDKGSITLSTDEDAIELCPMGLLNFTVKAKKKGNANKLSIKVEWKDSGSGRKCESTGLTVE